MKYADLRPGDKLTNFEHWGCVPREATRTVREDNAGLYVLCCKGRHWLIGQVDDNGDLVNCDLAP